MGFTRSKIEAIMLVSMAVAINLTFFYGFATKPIIEYHLSTPLDYNRTIDFDSEYLLVNLEASNTGLSPTRVELVVNLYNATLVEFEGFEEKIGEGLYKASITLDDPIRPSEFVNYNVTMRPEGNVTYLVLIFSVKSIPRHDPITGYYNSFTTFKPERPTALLLKHIDGNWFMRVRRR